MKDLKIYTNNIENKALEQINLMLEQYAFKDCKVRIMPDVHAGMGCVIGFTANLGDKVIPNVVGVDIGCGMAWVRTQLKEKDINLAELDEFIRNNIPSGLNVHNITVESPIDIKDLRCYNELRNIDHLNKSMGTLGGGNHFIEINKNKDGYLVFVVHTGSRNLGKQVCDIYQNKAIEHCSFDKEKEAEHEQIIKDCKENGTTNEIPTKLKALNEKYKGKTKLPKDLCYIEGQDREDYLHDMRLCQKWAIHNRNTILKYILHYGVGLIFFNTGKIKHTIHNYISDDNIVRKGAISAEKDEMVLIPMNMRDGSIIAVGKGNDDWNKSAPHGAGRIMSRADAKRKLELEKYKETMKDIYTTSVCAETIDEAPMVYKPMQEIIDCMQDTVDIVDIIKPIYNFKAKE